MEFKIKGKKVSKEEKEYLFSLGLRWCSKCKTAVDINNFSTGSGICKECSKNKRKNNLEYYRQKDKERYQNNKEDLIKKAAEYRLQHPKQIKELRDKYYQENKVIILSKNEEYRQANLDKIKIEQKEYRERNKERKHSIDKNYRQNSSKKINAHRRNRYNNDTEYKLRQVCREMVRRMFNAIDTIKDQTTDQVLGYSPKELKEHIEKQFKEGMTWDNYGEWNIDHIVPISSAKNISEGIYLSRLENLQPLWAVENILKGNKL